MIVVDLHVAGEWWAPLALGVCALGGILLLDVVLARVGDWWSS